MCSPDLSLGYFFRAPVMHLLRYLFLEVFMYLVGGFVRSSCRSLWVR